MTLEKAPPHQAHQESPLEVSQTQEAINRLDDVSKKTLLIGDSLGTGIDDNFHMKSLAAKSANLAQIEEQLNKANSKEAENLIIQGGTNDLNTLTPEQIAEKLLSLSEKAKAKGFKNVTVVTIPPHLDVNGKTFGTKANNVNEILRQKAKEGKINLFDLGAKYKEIDPVLAYQTDKVDGVHYNGKGYTIMATLILNDLLQKSGGERVDIATLNKILIQSSYNSIPRAIDYQAKALDEVTSEKSKTLQGFLSKVVEDIKKDPNTLSRYENKIKEFSIKELRTKTELLKGDSDSTYSADQEMHRRLAAYTTTTQDGGLLLNYAKFNSSKANHEMKVGLGDILPYSYRKVAVRTKSGEWKYGTRSKEGLKDGSGELRIGYKDEANGSYLATFTGDTIYVLDPAETDKNNLERISKAETSTRSRIDIELTAKEQRMAQARAIDERSTRVSSIITAKYEQIKTANPNLSEAEAYAKASEELNSDAEKEADLSRQEELKIAAKDCAGNKEALESAENFDLNLYKKAIAKMESGGNYGARNDAEGRRLGRPSNKWAFGKYQFIEETANKYGVNLNPNDEQSIQRFLSDHLQQEDVMNRFTLENLKLYASKPTSVKQALLGNGYDVYQVLAAMHFAGPKSINWASGKIEVKGEDWLGTSTGRYISTINAFTSKKSPSEA